MLLAHLVVLSIFTASSLAAEFQLDNGQDLSLFGIAIHQEKRNDIYIGALFVSGDIKESHQLLDTNIGKRMSLRFISKYSNRKMSRLWKQRIAMNNNKSSWQPYTKEIVQFSSVFQRSMVAGDELNIDYIPKIGTSVYLNGTLFLTVEKLEFYNVLLKVWIGSLPPSESFKRGINGKNKDSEVGELTQQYDSLQAEIGRFDEDKVKPIAVAKKTTKKEVKKKTVPKKQVKKTPTVKKEKSKSIAETESLVKELQSNVKVSTTTTQKTKPKIETTDILATNLTSKQMLDNGSNAFKLAGTENLSLKSNDKNKDATANDSNNSEELDEELVDADLLLGSYSQEIMRQVRRHQSYPQKAVIAGEEGFLIVKITIDKNGELISNKVIQRARSRSLNKGVLRIIRKSAPFPPIPKELGLAEFQIEIPMNFSLSD